ncbi:Phosducin-like protein 3 [Tetrabaena socialis]|uniref:Phosducin-like protein 3 n=1 Tax=Tetrabaena socialis TaxID=47790 RepID=A0A2J7ZP94_9CHLO|nr:Phosducin-like protein 3 [Tetrabaena socialis]|eukprot:PNH02094.1 Phosducin-like protein 3 [Tetrabaena socialis]
MSDKPFAAEAAQFGQAMNSINYSQVVEAAVRDYKRDVMDKQPQAGGKTMHQVVAMDDLMEDEELQKLHEDRIARLKAEREKRNQQAQKGHGTYGEISEGDFLEIVTQTDFVVVHFFHREFERCKIMDKHLQPLAHKYFNTRFIKVSAPDSPFFTVKLNIQMLPCIVGFSKGVAVGRITGFEGMGGRDDFPTSVLEDHLLVMGVITLPERNREDEDRTDGPGKNVRKSSHFSKTASDEDSDFE